MASTGRNKLSSIEIQRAKDRLLQYVDMLRMSQAEFCLTAGLDRRYLNNFTANLTPKIRKALEETYPALNLNWVLYNIGGMINEGYENDQKKVVPHRKPEGIANNISNVGGTVITQNGNNDTVEASGNHFEHLHVPKEDTKGSILEYFMRKLDEKDAIIAKLSEMICELSAPCK